MYERYAGLIFDMDGTILDTEPTHRKAWHEVLGRHGLRFDEQAMVALNGSPTWRIAQSVIELNHADLDPHALAREKPTALKACCWIAFSHCRLLMLLKPGMVVGLCRSVPGAKVPLQRRCSRI